MGLWLVECTIVPTRPLGIATDEVGLVFVAVGTQDSTVVRAVQHTTVLLPRGLRAIAAFKNVAVQTIVLVVDGVILRPGSVSVSLGVLGKTVAPLFASNMTSYASSATISSAVVARRGTT